jgi:hypothetical protein
MVINVIKVSFCIVVGNNMISVHTIAILINYLKQAILEEMERVPLNY